MGAVARVSLKQKCNTDAVERCSLEKMQHWLLQSAFLVISVDDEYGEAGEDDYERKGMVVHDMDAINELVNSTNFVQHAAYGRRNRRRKRKVKETEDETEKEKRTAEGTAD